MKNSTSFYKKMPKKKTYRRVKNMLSAMKMFNHLTTVLL